MCRRVARHQLDLSAGSQFLQLKYNMQKTILITGCSSGIGLAAARSLRAQNWQVLATARKKEDVAKLSAEGFQARQLDLDNTTSIQDGFAWAMRQTDQLDALFNNAGWGMAGFLEDVGRDALRAIFESNVFGPQELTNLVIRHMRTNKIAGRIIYNSSVLGYITLKNRVPYCATKYAVKSFADGLRLELRGTNIKCILIEPGPILSKFRENAYQAYKKWINPAQSLHRALYEADEKEYLEQTSDHQPPFTLGPEAVTRVLLRALNSRSPRTRYRVTFPSTLFWYLRRILPVRLLDEMLKGIK